MTQAGGGPPGLIFDSLGVLVADDALHFGADGDLSD
jgi:hypothetical protein